MARELRGPAHREIGHPHQGQGLGDAVAALGPGHPTNAQSVRTIVGDIAVRKERVVLNNGVDHSPIGG